MLELLLMRVLKTCLILRTLGISLRGTDTENMYCEGNRHYIDGESIASPLLVQGCIIMADCPLGLTSKGRIYSKHQDPKHSGPHRRKQKQSLALCRHPCTTAPSAGQLLNNCPPTYAFAMLGQTKIGWARFSHLCLDILNCPWRGATYGRHLEKCTLCHMHP